jgi:tetratricopeptide (TPR) repeat protein
VTVASIALVGYAWVQRNAQQAANKTPTITVDPRVAGFLSAGEKALAEGNLDLAKESFDKASALSERDPHVLLGLARLSAMRADTLWLKERLLPADATDELRITRDGLNELAAGARKAADAALSVAPDDPAAVRAKIDASRISGDREGARALVGKIAASSAQFESAYVLGALDLAAPEPNWSTAIDRLKVAVTPETGPGRARAALVYALARSGDVAGAKAEVERLSAMQKPHVLLPLLRSFADHAKAAGPVDAGAPVATAVAVATPVATGDAHEPASKNAARGEHAGAMPTDSRELLSQGEKARARGDYDRARTLFNAAIDKNPNDSEALAGLGAIAYAQHDLNAARTAYKRVVAINPNYMPAVIGLADVEWDAGDRATAARMYKDIVDRYPEGAYPARVKQRSDGGG